MKTPLRQVTLQQGRADLVDVGTRRSGKPRQRWAASVYKSVWKKHRHLAPKRNSRNPNKRRKYKGSTKQHQHIKKWAKNRLI